LNLEKKVGARIILFSSFLKPGEIKYSLSETNYQILF